MSLSICYLAKLPIHIFVNNSELKNLADNTPLPAVVMIVSSFNIISSEPIHV